MSGLPTELAAWVRRCLQTERALEEAEATSVRQAELLRKLKPKPPGSTSSSVDGDLRRSHEERLDIDERSSDGGRSRASGASLPAGRMMSPMSTKMSGQLGSRETAGPDMIRLLLVEDDPFQADAILTLCDQCGYNAQCASSAAEALAMVRSQPEINLVLSDVMMEGTSGYELLCRIRTIRSHVSVSDDALTMMALSPPSSGPRMAR